MANGTYHQRGELIDGFQVRQHPNYNPWATMKSRCSNVDHPSYKNYGGRGITYCKEWEHFATFCKDMGLRPSKAHSIERNENNDGYHPGNCVWATRTEQALNRRKFLNNTTGFTGVVKVRDRYVARVDLGKRHQLSGSFSTPEDAKVARDNLLKMVKAGASVDHLLERKARFDSTTGVRGITPHQKGGFLVRTTHNKARHYVGFFTTYDAALEALAKWKQEHR